MNTAIVYFSATGNGFDVANKLNLNLDDINANDSKDNNLYYMPHTKVEDLSDYETIIIITPIYGFSIPAYVKEYIKELSKLRDKNYYVIINYGGFLGNAVYNTQKYFTSNNLNIKNIYKLKMPESFTIFIKLKDDYVTKTLEDSVTEIEKIAMSIKKKESVKYKNTPLCVLDAVNEKIVTKQFSKFCKSYIVTDTCVSCKYCQKICLTNNITVEDNKKPVFGDKCVACLACYQRCPQLAINFGKKTIGKKRYINPNVDFNKMK